MPNKHWSDLTQDYLVEGKKHDGYMKPSSKGYGDGKTSEVVTNYGKEDVKQDD